MKKIPVIPECYKDLHDNTLMNSRDVCKMFGYKESINNLTRNYKNGYLPYPDITKVCRIRPHSSPKNFWKLGTIRKWENDNSI